MSHKTTFGERLAFERKRLGFNQSDFARLCGARSASQFLYEKNSRSPNTEYLTKAIAAGVRLGYLFEVGNDHPTSPLVTLDQILSAYIEVDGYCRDPEGRLLDLEYRVQSFKVRIVDIDEPSSEVKSRAS